jgi:hypothetical protein
MVTFLDKVKRKSKDFTTDSRSDKLLMHKNEIENTHVWELLS